MSTIKEEYPLLENEGITEITLTESDFSNVFEVVYTNPSSKVETVITVRTDVEG